MKSRFLLVLLVVPLLALAETKPQKTSGMVIKGDQEAPMVLYIVPWQEPKASPPPPAPLYPLIPDVLDRNDESVNRTSFPRVESPPKR